MFSTVIELISYQESTNDIGDRITGDPTYKKVFADEKGVRQSEFYQAASVGLKPETTYVIRATSYSNEKQVRVGGEHGVTMDIIRTYQKNRSFIELVCQGGVNGG